MVQGMVDGGELIRRTSGDSSVSLDHSPAMMVVTFLTFSLRNVASIGSVEGIVQGVSKVFKKIILELEREL